ncbi:DNA replication complex GINS family protein [Methanofollis tationis]|uniref:DNA replication complex GINS family protein n=1 Tax=Methanofollis tationis TaxID=81417 RepID=A0A7K4HQH8_9EURY|nr:DNA replication complex GINS family protein [Methanofollis tationis]NVO67525.1 DNA replication complex GINS family protein [Methanofollis tationis]
MDLDDLRIIVWNERESGKLSEVPAELFATGRASLKEIQNEIHAIGDPFSENGAVLQDRYHSIKETLSTIVKLRLKKILKLAEAQIEGGYRDRDEMKTMLPEERAMFDAVRREIALCRDQMLEEAAGASAPTREAEVPVSPGEGEGEDEAFVSFVEEVFKEEEEKRAGAAPVQTTPGDVSLVLVNEGIPPFMGLDGRTYALEAGDLVTLPKGNARVLSERNIALNIRLIK